MLEILTQVIENDEVKETAKKVVVGDRLAAFKESTLRRFCSGVEIAGGGVMGGVAGNIVNQVAILAGGQGALFVFIAGAGVGLLTFDLSSGVCKDILDKAAVTPYSEGGNMIQYEEITKWCKNLVEMDAKKFGRKTIKRLGKLVGRCHRFRVIELDEL
jgi:hypothetical protein